MIYLDNSATTRVYPEVVDVMTNVMQKVFGNPSSLHGLGVQAERLVDQARKVVAQVLRSSPQEILFTSGGTESNNIAVKGIAEQYCQRGKHLVTTEIEHASIHEVFRHLENRGWKVTYLPVDSWGRVSPDDVEKALTDETVLVSVMHTNNETGTIQPIREIGKRLKKYPKVFFHVDAIQSFGKIDLIPSQSQIDLLSFSGHKLHGPKGVGGLYIRKNLLLTPLLHGGGQERGLRSGTQNVPGIAGFAKALIMTHEQRLDFLQRTQEWKELLLKKLNSSLSQLKVNGDLQRDGGASYLLNLSFPGLKSEVLVHALEQEQVYVSSKSACSSKVEVSSRVLKAMGLSDQESIGAIRISMGYDTTKEDIEKCAEALIRVIPRLQQVMRVHK
ncbi:cysteine desulfurase family protein [Hazenella coriacea]|uniref:Cysteine desulfurase n=1 Tax=Hazenella coriacea TaxID=1179467 RepID=A0A4R3L5N8_9BACL|nr:cysteine desulfurase family protein [Hazenella coriacea]TCS94712.1 cysteine desulfurase [Hazenella coriacea]